MPTEDGEEQASERRRQHIEELKEKITAISGFPADTFISPDCPDEVAEKFLEHVSAFEDTRRQWAKDWPEDIVPPHEDPPYDRDQFMASLMGVHIPDILVI